MPVAESVRAVTACPECGDPLEEFEGELYCPLCTRFSLTPEPEPAPKPATEYPTSATYPTPAQVAMFRAFRASAGHHELAVLVGIMDLTIELIDRFKANHPRACVCDFCNFDRRQYPGAGIRLSDLVGVRWSIETAASMLGTDVTDQFEYDEGTPPADLLRQLAAFAEGGRPAAR
jgi:hypothetical protein